jgi:hypothetical protein
MCNLKTISCILISGFTRKAKSYFSIPLPFKANIPSGQTNPDLFFLSLYSFLSVLLEDKD